MPTPAIFDIPAKHVEPGVLFQNTSGDLVTLPSLRSRVAEWCADNDISGYIVALPHMAKHYQIVFADEDDAALFRLRWLD